MEFIYDGRIWKACYDSDRELYTAETWGKGCNELWEITKETFDLITLPDVTGEEAIKLIRTEGRCLLKNVCDKCGLPYSVILDSDYKDLCSWSEMKPDFPVWGEALTDGAVEFFDSQKSNRAQRRAKRKQRLV